MKNQINKWEEVANKVKAMKPSKKSLLSKEAMKKTLKTLIIMKMKLKSSSAGSLNMILKKFPLTTSR